jgi:hypothetical protein
MGWCTVIKPVVLLSSALLLTMPSPAQQPVIRIQPPQLEGSRPLEKQTESSVIRDYLESWKTMEQALDHNQVGPLDPQFIGVARDKLAETIDEQNRIGIHTRYQDQSHDLQIVFYSPEGLSVQMIDTVEYLQEILEKDKIIATKKVRQRYVVVLTPSEVRWRVRIFQAKSD